MERPGSVVDQHVLAFPTAPTGRFDQSVWTISDLSAQPWRNLLVSLHEVAHAGLNGSTAWGHLLQAVVVLAKSGEHPERHAAVLEDLVLRCRRTHEAHATHASATRVLGTRLAPPPSEILAGYPVYQLHLDDALRAGPGAALNRKWRQVAAESALLVCMQPDVLTTLLHVGPAAFVPAVLRERDSPDVRLAVVQRRGPGLWAAVERAAGEAFGRRWADLRQVGCGDPEAARDAEVWERLARLCRAAAASALAAEGLPTLDPGQVRTTRPALVEAVARAVGPRGGPIVLDEDPSSLFEAERVRLRAPIPARVRDLSPATAADLPTDEHVLVAVRRPGTLRRQFDLRNTPWPPERTEPVVAVRTRRPGEIDLLALSRPDDLAVVRSRAGALLVSVALTCARDGEWASRWSPAFSDADTVTILLDTPVAQSLDALLADEAEFRFTIVPAGSPEAGLSVLVCSVGDYPAYLRPCSTTAAGGFRIHLLRRGGAREVAGLDDLSPSHRQLQAVIDRLVTEESLIETQV